ncbi:MAG: ABC transporter ATP-binding protein [Clostridiales Family XIII bacterium]|jgi:putative ABC transport system ATP-binding protein|nr:ABC transporter ATP-binding protein [Clostridiales Family XIII bacterium]
MIVMEDIRKYYQVGDNVVKALDGVSLTIEEGSFIGIVGPSGSGKSTLMHIMGCLDAADYGMYLLDGYPIEAYSQNELAAIRNHKIGFVFQSFNLISRMSIEENVELPLIYRGLRPSERKTRVAQALAQVGMTERRRHTPSSISGGQQQRAAIARALVTEPAMILADEPTGNLDSRTGGEIMELFRDLNKAGRTIVLITHDPSVAEQTGRVVRIMDGRITEVKENRPWQ